MSGCGLVCVRLTMSRSREVVEGTGGGGVWGVGACESLMEDFLGA